MEIEIDVYRKSNGHLDIGHEKITEEDLESLIRRWYLQRDWKYEIEGITIAKIQGL